MTLDEHELEEKAREAVLTMLRNVLSDHFGLLAKGSAFDRCQSVQERIFFIWWVGLMLAHKIRPGGGVAFNHPDYFEFPFICPQPQKRISWGEDQFYDADFTVGHSVIEIDGRQFHERTPEQVTERNKRDARLQLAGWSIFHCSVSELDKNPQAAVMRIARAVFRIEHRRLGGERNYA